MLIRNKSFLLQNKMTDIYSKNELYIFDLIFRKSVTYSGTFVFNSIPTKFRKCNTVTLEINKSIKADQISIKFRAL